MLQTAVILAVILLTSLSLYTKPAQAASGGCDLIDRTLPAVRLSFPASQDEFVRQGQVGLTLLNNTTCLLFVPSNGNSDAAALRILYDIQDARRTRVPTHKGYWVDSDLAFYKELPPGKSLPVAIEKTHATRKLTISVRYLFSWETNGSPSGDFEHRVYFDSSSWPKA